MAVIGVLRLRSAPGGRHGLVEHVGPSVGLHGGVEDGGIKLVCRQSLCVAVLGPVALAGEARVVAVPVAIAHGARADEVLAALGADDEAGQ
ncbi:MAG: hypothetical protein M0Z95_16115 [Actinomycetota bacterium]|nr:hypothetical protein [Actinomycetota bacterium]